MFRIQLQREWCMAMRALHELLNPLVFFVMIASLLPLAVGADPELLQSLGAGIIWVMALLASLLSFDSLFRSDYDDGTLDQLLLLPQGVFWPVLAKIFAHWLACGLPLTLLSPLLALMFGLPAQVNGSSVYAVLVAALLPGTLYFSFIGAIGAALTVCLRRGGVLLPLIIMPFYIPALVFGAGSVTQAMQGLDASASLAILTALSAFAVALSPLVITVALRIGVEG
jgi:heme exporter protein B